MCTYVCVQHMDSVAPEAVGSAQTSLHDSRPKLRLLVMGPSGSHILLYGQMPFAGAGPGDSTVDFGGSTFLLKEGAFLMAETDAF